VGSTISQKRLIDDLNVLGRKQLDIVNVQVYENGINEDLTIKTEDGEIDRHSRIILVNTKGKDTSRFHEVEHAMRIWLYLKERQISFSIIAVETSFNEKWVNDNSAVVIIKKNEFEDIYSSISMEDMNVEEQIIILSQAWIEKYEYKRMPM